MNHWTYDQFVAFVMLYAASADLKLTDEEMEVVHEKAKDGYDDVIEVFQSSNDMQCLEIIVNLKEKYIKSDSSKEKLARDLHELFLSDQEFSMIERGMDSVLRKIL